MSQSEMILSKILHDVVIEEADAIAEEEKPLAPTRVRPNSKPKTFNERWSPEEDKLLTSLATKKPRPNWKQISPHFPNKTSHQVIDRWDKVLNPALVKGSWRREEDQTIIDWVQENGPTSWTKLAVKLPGRIGKQCRERWHNSLNPDLVKKKWTSQEDEMIIRLQGEMGNKWSQIAELLPGRTDNAVKNRWNSALKKRVHARPPELTLPAPSISDMEIISAKDRNDFLSFNLPSPISAVEMYDPGLNTPFGLDYNLSFDSSSAPDVLGENEFVAFD